MAGAWDHFFKSLVSKCSAQYAAWVEEKARFLQELNIELKSKHCFADALLKVMLSNQEGLLHVEFQTAKDNEMEDRLLEYNVLASREHNLPVYSYVVYLRKHRKLARSPYIKRFVNGKETIRFHYKVIKLWEIPAEQILAEGQEGLLPFLLLTKGGKKPELVKLMIDTLAKQQEWELLASAYVLGSLVYTDQTEKAWFQRRFEMHQEIFRDSWAYQSIGETFRKEGLQQGLQQAIMNIVQARFPEVVALAQSQIEQIHDQATLNALTIKVGTAQTGEEVLRFLDGLSENVLKRQNVPLPQ